MKLCIRVEGRAYEVEVDFLDAESNGRRSRAGLPAALAGAVLRPRPPQKLPEDGSCRSPIAGRVAAIVCVAGRAVLRHEPVVVLEAMKMQIPVGPAVDGTVKSIHVEVGDAVAAGQVLFEMA